MSNELLLWGSFIVPWLTLFFMPKQDIKRYMPVGLLTAVLSALIIDIGIAFGLWSTSQTVFPFSLLPPIIYGLPVFAMWVFKLTYGRFWLYAVTNAVLDLAFDYLILPWLASRGMFDYNLSVIDFIITTTHAWLLYGYQMWQETIFAYSPSTTRYASSLQPAVAKPLPPEEDSLDKD